MSSEFGNIKDSLGSSQGNVTLDAMQRTRAEETRELTSEQISSKQSMQSSLEETVNPFARLQKLSKTLDTNKARIQKLLKSLKTGKLLPAEQIKDSANQFQQRNPELKAPILIMLRELIKPGDTKEEIIKKLRDFYQDVSLADEVLDFLYETSEGDLQQTVKEAHDEFSKQFEREITAGRNISEAAHAAAEQGLGTPTNLRDLYRNITGSPRDSSTLFQELSQKYVFKELKKVVDFLLHSLGSDMKAKGPSIPRGQLHRLITETRSLQAILGVYRFFKSRMPLVDKLFQKEGLDVPPQLNFESMSKLFMSLAGERYPTADKILQSAVRLGIEKWVMAKIIALSQVRDAIREVAVNQIYRSVQHRDELYMAILEALEDLEDELEELLERDQSDEDKDEDEEEE
jgi:type III secretion protein W